MTCCEHCPTLTDEEREDIAFRKSRLALSRPVRLNVTAKPTSIRRAIYNSPPIIRTVVAVSNRTIQPQTPRDPIG